VVALCYATLYMWFEYGYFADKGTERKHK
jgi:hypothetical protein